ncbi:GAF and ANTAR domain-containing protein [Cellulomonas sp. URHB0016]
MSARTSAQVLADVASALVADHETTGLLARLVSDAAEVLPADAVALLVRSEDGGLELLSATSHRAAELELYQSQRLEGPCVDVIRTGTLVSAHGADEIAERWGKVGRAVVDAGFLAVYAFPMHWRDHVVGGLNVFSAGADELSPSAVALGQSLANFATLAIVQPTALADDELGRRVTEALAGRVVVERAKGVLAVQLDVDMAQAYAELLRRSSSDGSSLAATAEQIVHAAQQR